MVFEEEEEFKGEEEVEGEEPETSEETEEGGAEEKVEGVAGVFEQEKAMGEEKVAYMVYPTAKEIKNMIQALAEVLTETVFKIDESGIRMRALDPSKVALIQLELPSVVFTEYDVKNEISVGLSLDTMAKVMKRAKAKEVVEFEVFPTKFNIYLHGKKTPRRRFGLPVLSLAEEEIPEASLEFEADIAISADVLTEVLKAADEVADYIEIEATPDALIFRCAETEKKFIAEYPSSSEAFISYNVKSEKVAAKYSLDYLYDFVNKMSKVSDVAYIKFSNQKPIDITFEIPGGGKVEMLLAPRAD